MIHPDDRARTMHASTIKPARGDYDETYRILRPDGSVRWIHDRAFPVRAASGEVLRVVGMAADITERRLLEEQLRQSQKMEAIGQLAGGVAHDFNNILAAIMMQADLAAAEAGLPEGTRELFDDIRANTERAANLTRQLLAFSRRQVMQPRQLDLNEVVTSLTKMLQRLVGEDVRLQLNLHPRPLLTRGDPGMLDQVLLNLVVNARDAMPGGGRLFITTAERVLSPQAAAAMPDALAGRHACLRVSDTGSGIDPLHLPRIFEPFFTTKEAGKGTGLGLATVFGIVKQHRGWVTVDSAVGEGTTFEVMLPIDEDAARARTEAAATPALRRGTETILLVEDEPGVRMLTRVVLERQGYRVLEAAHGLEAVRLWDQHQAAIRLLLTDIVMPEGVNGRELAGRFRAANPTLPVIFTSGYSADIAGRELALQEGQNFLQKPFSPRQLLEIVDRSLAR
jgi:signal transduction histidine kinase